MKVLIGCINFNSYTGSELYVYELARELVNMGVDVTVCSNIGGDLANRAERVGIKLMPLANVNRTQNFDILHVNHHPIAKLLIHAYPTTPAICGIHSEIISMEYPYIHQNIKRYIAIRPEIKELLINVFKIEPDKISVIYNPVDDERFRDYGLVENEKKIVLCVGSIHVLRKNMLIDLINSTKKEGSELWLVGKEHEVKVKDLTQMDHIKLFPPTWDVERYVKQCDETAGILLGRTTIESWLCCKPSWIYDVNQGGEIQSKKLYSAPEDTDKFKSKFVSNEIMKEYIRIIEHS